MTRALQLAPFKKAEGPSFIQIFLWRQKKKKQKWPNWLKHSAVYYLNVFQHMLNIYQQDFSIYTYQDFANMYLIVQK